MKKILVAFLILILLAIGYLFYRSIFWGRVVTVSDIVKSEQIILNSRGSFVSNVRFQVTGDVDGEVTFLWNCSDSLKQECEHTKSFGPGHVDFTHQSDWYNKKYLLRYQPSNNVRSGKLKIRYSL